MSWKILAVACGLFGASKALSCGDLVVAGGGTGGLYSAWRMIEAGLADPTKTCIFEQTQRVGKKKCHVEIDGDLRRKKIKPTMLTNAVVPFSVPLEAVISLFEHFEKGDFKRNLKSEICEVLA